MKKRRPALLLCIALLLSLAGCFRIVPKPAPAETPPVPEVGSSPAPTETPSVPEQPEAPTESQEPQTPDAPDGPQEPLSGGYFQSVWHGDADYSDLE